MKHRISLDELYDEPIEMIGIYSPFPSFQLAYHINRHLGIRLEHSGTLEHATHPLGFNVYEYRDTDSGNAYTLFENFALVFSTIEGDNLFSASNTLVQRKVYFLPRMKDYTHFIRVMGEVPDAGSLYPVFRKIPGIEACTGLDPELLKNTPVLYY